MNKNEHVRLLANAYCDLIESKLTVTGKIQNHHLNELHDISMGWLANQNKKPGLEDLYNMFGTPETVAAMLSDPETRDLDIESIINTKNAHAVANEDPMRIMGCKKLTHAQAKDLMARIAAGEELSAADFEQYEDAEIPEIINDIINHRSDDDCDCKCHDIEEKLAEMASAFEEANALADAGADVAEISLHTDIPTTALYIGGFGEPADDIADFIIPVRFTMQGFVKVKATSVADAIMTADMNSKDIPVPEQSTLVPDTMKICHDESMVAMFTDKFRLGKLKLDAADSDIVTPLIHRDEVLEKADPDIIMDTILSIMGIDTDDCDECDCGHEHNILPISEMPSEIGEWVRTGDDDEDDDADAYIEISMNCDGKCSECGVPESFGSCPIMAEQKNHDPRDTVTLNLTIPCYGKCCQCPVPNYLGECPIKDWDDEEDTDDEKTNYDDDDCFFDDIDELPEELRIHLDEE